MDLAFDFSLILDISAHPKIVFLNIILATKLGCKAGEVDVNQVVMNSTFPPSPLFPPLTREKLYIGRKSGKILAEK